MTERLHVLYEDNHLLALVKPCGLATMGLREGEPTLLEQARAYIKHKYEKPGNVYLGVVSRLDTPVSGVVVFARTSKAARRLSEQFRSRSVEKLYWALVLGTPQPASAACTDWLKEDVRHRKMAVARAGEPSAKEARLRYELIARLADASLLEIRLETGRKHQIRVQLARRGLPILGDRKYGSRHDFVPGGIALHARRLVLEHPTRREPLELTAPVPDAWHGWGVED